ncbi:hypothetical protein DFH06DRAFT_471686 [Mycena polygramma]|nr:hypothetical protein DFH06DRAFT_471686 [Mycena polygramma]
MAHLTTALLGSLSRVFFPPSAPDLGISHSKSDPDLALHVDTHLHPASSTSVRPRPASAMAIEGYWGWGWDTEAQGTMLRRRTRTERDVGLKAPADVKLTDSPVLCQPPRPARTGTPLPIAGAPVAPAPLVDVVNTLAPERAGPTAATLLPTYTADRRDYSEPDSSFELSHSFDISLISDTSTDDSEGDGSFSFTLPPAPALVSTYGTLQRRADSEPDSSLDFSHSFDISLITATSMSSDEYSELSDISFGSFSFTLPPQSPATPATPLESGLEGLGIAGLYKPSGAPFDGMGVLSFGVCGSSSPPSFPPLPHIAARTASPSPSRSRSHAQTPTHMEKDDGLSRTFLEEAAWTWARDPEHHYLTVINEEPGELYHYLGLGAAHAQERERVVDVCGDTDTSRIRCGGKSRSASKSMTRVFGHGVDRDTISSGLKRLNPRPALRSRSRFQAAGVPTRAASDVPGQGREARRVWRA